MIRIILTDKTSITVPKGRYIAKVGDELRIMYYSGKVEKTIQVAEIAGIIEE